MKGPSVQKQPPPANEGGWGWIAIVSAILLQILVSGYMLSISVLLVEWQLFFDANAQTVGVIGVILGFLGPTSGFPVSGLSKTLGCRTVVIIGGVVMTLSKVITSFATKIYHLYLTTALTGLAIGLCYQPTVMVISFYFQKRLGLANGLAMSGVGIGMLVMPPFIQLLIDSFTWKKAFLILASVDLLLIVCGLLFRPSSRELYYLQARTKQKPKRVRRKSVTEVSYSYLWRLIKFLGLQMIWQEPTANLIFVGYGLFGFGFYSSLVFFTSKAVFDLDIEPDLAAWLISVIGIGSFLARISHGWLVDLKVIPPSLLYVLSTMSCCISSFLNPFMPSFLGLAICAFILGAGSGTSVSITIVCLQETVEPTHMSNAWGICLLFFGAGNLIGVYLIAFLYDMTGSYDVSFYVSAGALLMSASSLMALYLIKARKSRMERSGQDLTAGKDIISGKEYESIEAPRGLERETTQENLELML